MNPYNIASYRYAKGTVVVQPLSDGSGWATRAARLAGSLGGRWVHRAGGYVMTPGKAKKFEALFAAGYDGNLFTGAVLPPT